MKKEVEKIVNEFLYGFGICQKCGAKDIRFTSKGNLVNHNGCRCRIAVKPVGFLQSLPNKAYNGQVGTKAKNSKPSKPTRR